MSSHKPDGGRIPRPKDFSSQPQKASSPATASTVGGFPISLFPKPQMNSTRNSRSSSVSDAEPSPRIPAPSRPSRSSRTSSSNDVRSSLLPRPNTNSLPRASPLSPTSPLATNQIPQPTKPQPTSKVNKQLVNGLPRNVLRRKAPTIGQYGGKNGSNETRPRKLSVIIPNSVRPSQAVNATPRTPWDQPELARLRQLPSSQDKIPNKPMKPPIQGPKELASLRTTVNTSNLTPPTPSFPSASTPSTKYSGSPGIWSRGSTPTSLSSASPGIVQPSKLGYRMRHPSPSQTRLPFLSSPISYPSPQNNVTEQRSIKSPQLGKGEASSTSLGQSLQGTSKNVDSTNANPSSGLSRSSHIEARFAPKAADASIENEEQARKGPINRRGSEGTVASPVKGSTQSPRRPSRDGTHRLELEPSPVIQSNLPPNTVSFHKRRESAEKTLVNERQPLSNQSAATSVDSLHSKSPPQAVSTNTSPVLSRKSPLKSSKGKDKQESKIPATPKRFGLFPKKSKSDLDPATLEQIKSTRKGPVAGTGHEGYGKYSQRGRKSSLSSTSGTRTRSSSATRTSKSTSNVKGGKNRNDMEIDDFLLNRLEPVVINGGGMNETALTKTQNQQSAFGSGSNATKGSTDSLAPSETTREPLKSSNGKIPDNHQTSALSRPPSNIAEKLARTVTNPADKPPTHHYSLSMPQVSTAAYSHPEQKAGSQIQKSPKKIGKLRNFFQRSHLSDRKNSTASETAVEPPTAQLHAKISPITVNRPVAHYALVDTDSDPLEDIMNNIDDSPLEEEKPESPVKVPAALNIRKRESILLPSLPQLQRGFSQECSSPKVFFKDSTAGNNESTGEKTSRLASIGRIPRVVSRRDRQHRPAMQSFSRPFSIVDSPSLTVPVDKPDCPLSDAPDQPENKPHNPGFDLLHPFGDPLKGSVLDFIAGPYAKNEFLTLSNKRSNSSSSGSAAVTAVIPSPGSEPTEDEVWGEYDDLIDRVLSPQTSRSVFPFVDADEKFELATMASKNLQAELNGADRLSTLPEHPALEMGSRNGSIRLRRSRIAEALRSSVAPSSRPSYSELVAKYGDPQHEEKMDMYQLMPPDQSTTSLTSQSFETSRQRNTILFDIAERDREGPTAQTNIRSGSLMTSRWLSFGRVLFSPAHNHVKSGEQERILVIDGLGNDDWSFYCALTYPHADVYSLDIRPNLPSSTHPAAWQPPANHHTVHHNLENPLPFPKSYFTVTVLRFPAACPEYVQDNIVSECKRVLRPGGYIEMSLLDLDMVNMGIRTRKAIRRLKERTYLADSSISLKPASDNIQRFLGRHGFDNLRRCMVRIPVAGMITRSSASSSSTSSSTPPSSAPINTYTFSLPNPNHNKHGKCPSNETDLSLGDLLSDPSPSNDESIRKIVAKVGRWWYTRCYEIPVLPDGDVSLSIWDRKVLRECRNRGTGFRFLIAHAQKPSEKRRTASV